jgi:hypothetical protein
MKCSEWWEAPEELIAMDGHCGLVAAWSVLRYFGVPTDVPRLVRACRHTKRHGVFAISLATCLKEHGLQVSFHSDPDNDIGGWERRGYVHAQRLGLQIMPALDVPTLLRERKRGRVPIVLYNTPSDSGHFSPVLSISRGVLHLPMADGGKMPLSEFLARWSAPRILRQSIIVGSFAGEVASRTVGLSPAMS